MSTENSRTDGAEAPLPGPVGRYTPRRLLGKTGKVEVYLADGAGPAPRPVALKLLAADAAGDAELVKALLDGARLAAPLTHPNIVQIHDVGEDDGRSYVAMELLRGASLRRIGAQLHPRRQKLPERVAAAIGAQVAAALAHAHGKLGAEGKPTGVSHGAVTPFSIYLTEEGFAKLLDFGGIPGDPQPGVRPALTTGFRAYVAPEQVKGAGDGRSDVFALGATLWELLGGEPPFRGDTIEALLHAIATDYPREIEDAVPGCDPDLAAIVMSTLERHPALRPSAVDLQRSLESVVQKSGLSTPQATIASFIAGDLVTRPIFAAARLAAMAPPPPRAPYEPRIPRPIPDASSLPTSKPLPRGLERSSRPSMPPPPDPSKPEAKAEPHRPEAKAEVPKPDATIKVEAPKPEPRPVGEISRPKWEPPWAKKTEPKPEVAKVEAPKAEPAKVEAPKPEATINVEATKPEPAKAEAPKPEATSKGEAPKPEAAKVEAAEPAKSEAEKPATAAPGEPSGAAGEVAAAATAPDLSAKPATEPAAPAGGRAAAEAEAAGATPRKDGSPADAWDAPSPTGERTGDALAPPGPAPAAAGPVAPPDGPAQEEPRGALFGKPGVLLGGDDDQHEQEAPAAADPVSAADTDRVPMAVITGTPVDEPSAQEPRPDGTGSSEERPAEVADALVASGLGALAGPPPDPAATGAAPAPAVAGSAPADDSDPHQAISALAGRPVRRGAASGEHAPGRAGPRPKVFSADRVGAPRSKLPLALGGAALVAVAVVLAVVQPWKSGDPDPAKPPPGADPAKLPPATDPAKPPDGLPGAQAATPAPGDPATPPGAGKVRVKVETTPAGAAISCDDESVLEATPGEFEIDPGKHRLVASKDGHLPATVQKVVSREDAAWTVTLEPAAYVKVKGPEGASLWLDGENTGELLPVDRLPVAAGKPHKLELLEGEEPVVRNVPGLAAGKLHTVSFGAGKPPAPPPDATASKTPATKPEPPPDTKPAATPPATKPTAATPPATKPAAAVTPAAASKDDAYKQALKKERVRLQGKLAEYKKDPEKKAETQKKIDAIDQKLKSMK